jgi:hypothetical protein
MRTTWWVRGAAVTVTGLAAVLVSGAAWGDANVPLRSGQAPMTAVGFPTHICDGSFGGGPYPDLDVWSFVLPDSDRQFVSMTASFDTNGDHIADTTLSAPAAGGIDGRTGTSKAWIIATAGATLLNASAVVTGTTPPHPNSFNIARTCSANWPPSPSPGASQSPSATGGASQSTGDSAGTGGGAGMGTGWGTGMSLESLSPSTWSGQGTMGSPGPGETPGASAGTGPNPNGAPNTGTGSDLNGAPNTDSGDILSGSKVVLGAGALLGSVACVGALMMLRQRRNPFGRRRRVS